MENKTLSVLVQLAQTGNAEALERLCCELRKQIEYPLKSTFKDPEVVKDLAQETYLRLLKGFQSVKEPVKIRHFVAAITLSVMNDYFRRRSNKKIITVENLPHTSRPLAEYESRDEEAVHNKISIAEILGQVANSVDRSILERRLEGRSFKEISSSLSITEGAAKMRFKRAVDHLKIRLKI